MKHSTFLTTLLLQGILLPLLSFAQITHDELLLEPNYKFNSSFDSLIIQSERHSVALRGGDDLLLATRFDDWSDGSLINSDSSEYYYDANNLLIELIGKTVINDEWFFYNRTIFEYDANNNRTLQLKQIWDGINWMNDLQDIYEYDANNNQTLQLKQIWDGVNWVNDYQILYYYEIFVSNSNFESSDLFFQVFPNPSNTHLTIDIGEYDFQNGSVNIYNSIGQLIYSQVIQNGTNRKSLNLSDFSEDIYFLQLTLGDNQATKSFIVAH
jgi:Secretion system C-terminal sorting domain